MERTIGDADAPQDARERTPAKHAVKTKLRRPHAVQAPHAGDVDEADHGRDDDRRERSVRQVVEQPGGEQQDDARQPRPTSAGQLRSRPAASATGVRDELLESGKPWNSPVAALAAPSATELLVLVDVLAEPRSRSCARGRSCRRRRAGDPERADGSCRRSPADTDGIVERRQPLGQAPTTATPRRRGRRARRPASPGHRDEDAGTTGATPLQEDDHGETRDTERQGRCRSSRRGARRRHEPPPGSVSPPPEKPNSFGSWVMITVSAIPAR